MTTIVKFLQQTLLDTGRDRLVVAVSGGIDSAVALNLCVQAVGAPKVFALLLPYGDQNMDDAQAAIAAAGLPAAHIRSVNIQPAVDLLATQLTTTDPLRRGNLMARIRMVVLYDWAKAFNALVCGTENKSEKYLGYFTRFGDAASDIEPIQHLTKTQIRDLAALLSIPQVIIDKPPSAGLWAAQTDEAELGFTYAQADQVIPLLIDQHLPVDQIIEQLSGIAPATIQRICQRITSQEFKLVTPYHLPDKPVPPAAN